MQQHLMIREQPNKRDDYALPCPAAVRPLFPSDHDPHQNHVDRTISLMFKSFCPRRGMSSAASCALRAGKHENKPLGLFLYVVLFYIVLY